MAEMFKVLTSVIVMMAFYSFAINAIVYTLPDPAVHYITAFSEGETNVNVESIANDVQGNLNRQTTIPVIDLGALVFYSGNIAIDLIMNFAFAIPQMFGMFFQALEMIFGFDSQISTLVTGFMGVLISILYIIGIIQFILNARTRSSII